MHLICYYFRFYLNEISSLHCFVCIPTATVVSEDITTTHLNFRQQSSNWSSCHASISLPPSVLPPLLRYPPAKQCSHMLLLLKDSHDHSLPRGWCQNSPCAYGAYLGCVCRMSRIRLTILALQFYLLISESLLSIPVPLGFLLCICNSILGYFTPLDWRILLPLFNFPTLFLLGKFLLTLQNWAQVLFSYYLLVD